MKKTMKTARTILAMTTALAAVCGTSALAAVTAEDVLNDLHAANHMEIHMGRMAQKMGSQASVRDYGKTLESDHESNDKKVMELAAKENITLKPAKPGIMDNMEMKKLESLSGAEFDQKFSKEMIDDHKKDIEKMQSAQKAQLPDDVRQLVGDTLPTLQKHLEIAQKIYGQPS